MPPLAQAAPADLSRELEALLGVVMAWLGGDDGARPSPTQSGSLAEALGAALVALWEDRIAGAPVRERAALSAAALDKLPVGAGLLDRSGRVLQANPALLQLLDRHGADTLGRTLPALLELSPARWADWVDEADVLGQLRAVQVVSRASGPLRLQVHLAPHAGGWAMAVVEACPIAAPARPAPGPPLAAALLDEALAAGLTHGALRALLADLSAQGAEPPPLAGRRLWLRDGGAGPEAVAELGFRLRARGAQLAAEDAPIHAASGPAAAPPDEVWVSPSADAQSPRAGFVVIARPGLAPAEENDQPNQRGPMSSSPTPAFDAATVATLTEALSGHAEPCAVSHLPVLDREATAYLAEVEQATGKTGLFDRLLALFINDLARHEAGISAASAAADWSGLGRAAHGIKGSAATIGARRIEHVSRALEASCRAEGGPPDPAQLTALAAQLVSLCDAFRAELGPA